MWAAICVWGGDPIPLISSKTAGPVISKTYLTIYLKISSACPCQPVQMEVECHIHYTPSPFLYWFVGVASWECCELSTRVRNLIRSVEMMLLLFTFFKRLRGVLLRLPFMDDVAVGDVAFAPPFFRFRALLLVELGGLLPFRLLELFKLAPLPSSWW